jgi:hypothetical protein
MNISFSPPLYYFINYQNIAKEKNMILEPMCVLFKLCLLTYKPQNTKISIQNNSLTFIEPSYGQGLWRTIQGDSREDLHNLYYPLLKLIEWYPKTETQYSKFYKIAVKGLENLKNTYDNNSTIHHTIIHYIQLLTDGISDKSEQDKIKNPLIDELKDYWNDSEIKIMNEMLILLENNNTYKKSFEDIISSKEEKLNKYINEKSTSY